MPLCRPADAVLTGGPATAAYVSGTAGELTAGGDASAPPAGTRAPRGPGAGAVEENWIAGGIDGTAVKVEGRLRQLPSVPSRAVRRSPCRATPLRAHLELFARKPHATARLAVIARTVD